MSARWRPTKRHRAAGGTTFGAAFGVSKNVLDICGDQAVLGNVLDVAVRVVGDVDDGHATTAPS